MPALLGLPICCKSDNVMDFPRFRAYLSIGVVIVLLVVLHGSSLLIDGWNNLGFIVLQKADQNLSIQGIVRPRSFPMIDGRRLKQVYTYLGRSEAISSSLSSAYGLGIADLAQGSYDYAAQRFRAIWPQRSNLVSLYLGYALHRQGKTQEALAVWRAGPDISIGLRGQARSLLNRGLVDDAISIFTWIAELKPDSVQAWLDLSEGYANKGDWLQIASISEKAAALEPDNLDVRILQAQVAFRAHGDVATALHIVEDLLPRLRVIDSFDDEFRLYNGYVFLSQLTQNRGKPDEAIDWLKQAMALPSVGDRWVMVDISQIYQSEGDREQALDWMNRAIAEGPNDYSMYSALGYLLISQGDTEGAHSAFEREVTLAPHTIGPHNDLASLLAKIGRTAEAEVEYRKVLGIDPANQVARDGLKALGIVP
jgi:tetratricopeptide (TPR) repeat protein